MLQSHFPSHRPPRVGYSVARLELMLSLLLLSGILFLVYILYVILRIIRFPKKKIVKGTVGGDAAMGFDECFQKVSLGR
jgi:hypothetical protein